jgi:D-glycero-D-manno-heptose 1,7-bisphosphate phosphatase
MNEQRRAVFLDRDGVINEDRGYVHTIENFHFLPGALEGCQRMAAAGYALVVVTNQAGIARGIYSAADLERLTAWVSRRFAECNAPIAKTYYCPHHPEAVIPALRRVCDCRKPAAGLLIRAQRDLLIDMRSSVLIGDKESDIEAGRTAGIGRCILVCSANARASGSCANTRADAIVADLVEASALVIAT